MEKKNLHFIIPIPVGFSMTCGIFGKLGIEFKIKFCRSKQCFNVFVMIDRHTEELFRSTMGLTDSYTLYSYKQPNAT